VISSGLTELLDENELRWAIAHELGHIKSGHMLYRTMALFLALVGFVAIRNLPFLGLITEALKLALYDWSRKSELSADRAGLLVAQDPQVAVGALLKLAAGPTGASHTLSLDEFLKQADEYEDMSSNILDAFYAFEIMKFQTHPFPALRAREINRWSETEEYRAILQGEYPRVDSESLDRRCPKCAALIWNPVFRFCPECGGPLG
jgi:Zn-dependent protease with chaperone function